MNMIERVAKAVWEHRARSCRWEELSEWQQWGPLFDAEAAIQEMREPTEAMLDGGLWGTIDREFAATCWTGMIDAALAGD